MPSFWGCRCCSSPLFMSIVPGYPAPGITIRKQKNIGVENWSASLAPLASGGSYYLVGGLYLKDGTAAVFSTTARGIFRKDGTYSVAYDQAPGVERLSSRHIDSRGGRLFAGLYPIYGLDPDGTVTTFSVPNTYKNYNSTLIGDVNKNLLWAYKGSDGLIHVAQYDASSGSENWTADLPYSAAFNAVISSYPSCSQWSIGHGLICADNDGNSFICMYPLNSSGAALLQYGAIFKITSSGSVSEFCDFSPLGYSSIFGASTLAYNEFNGSLYLSMIAATGGTYTARVIQIMPDGTVSGSYLDYAGYVTGGISCSPELGYVFGVFQNYLGTQWNLRVYNEDLTTVIDESGSSWSPAKFLQS